MIDATRESMPVSIQIHTMGDSFAVDTEPDAVVANVKSSIEDCRQIPFAEQKLLLGCRILGDNIKIEDLLRECGNILELFLVRENSLVIEWIQKVSQDYKILFNTGKPPSHWGGPDRYEYDAPSDTAPDWAWSDRRIIMAGMRQSRAVLKFAAPHIKSDPEVALAGVRQGCDILEYVAAELRADRSFMLSAVREHPHALEFASEELRKDRAVVRVAMKKDYRVLGYAEEACKRDRAFMLAAIKQDHRVLDLAHKDLLIDKSFLIAAAKTNWRVLILGWSYSSDGILVRNGMKDRDVVLAALSHDWQAFQYAEDAHKADAEIVLIAARKDSRALLHASPKIFDDRDFVFTLLEQVLGSFAFLPVHIREDRGYISYVLNYDPCALRWTSAFLQDDYEIALAAVTKLWRSLEFVSPRLKADRTIVHAAARQSSIALRFADPSLKDRKKLFSD